MRKITATSAIRATYVPEVGIVDAHDSDVADGQTEPRVRCIALLSVSSQMQIIRHTLLHDRVTHGAAERRLGFWNASEDERILRRGDVLPVETEREEANGL